MLRCFFAPLQSNKKQRFDPAYLHHRLFWPRFCVAFGFSHAFSQTNYSISIPLISTKSNPRTVTHVTVLFCAPSVKQKTAVRSRLSPPPGNPPWNCVPGLFYFLCASIEHPLQQVIAEGVCIKYQYVKLSQLQSCLLTQSSSLVSVLPGQVYIGATKVTISSSLLIDGAQQIQLTDDTGGAQRKILAD